MADILRIKRRSSGSPGAPTSLANAELAYNEVDHTLYYGEGTGGAGGTASVVVAIGGQGVGSSALPIMDGTAAAGVATALSRGDHVHPTDTTRAPLASPALTGVPTAPTATAGTSTTQLATTAFVTAGAALPAGTVPIMDGVGAVGSSPGWARGDHVHPSDTSRAPLASPVFTGDPQAPTPAVGDNDTSVATTAFVKNQGYAPLASPVFTGDPQAPTPPNTDNDTSIATTAFVKGQRLDEFQPPAGPVNFNNQQLQNLASPGSPNDAATKAYVDGASQGLVSKAAVQAGTTGANIALSGLQVIDGYTTVAGDRILVKDQTAAANNGIYAAASGSWTRVVDMDTWSEVPNAYVFVVQGTVNQNSSWVCTSLLTGGTIGVTAITWVQFSQSATVNAGNGLNKVGNTLNVIGTAGRIAVGAAVDIDAGYVGQASIVTLGGVTTGTWNATAIAVAHGGSGAVSLTGYLKGNGTAAFTGNATIPLTDIPGLGTMAVQNANAVAITGGTIDGITLDGGTF